MAKLSILSGPGPTPIENFDPAWCKDLTYVCTRTKYPSRTNLRDLISTLLYTVIPATVRAVFDQFENASGSLGAGYYTRKELPLKQ